MKSTVEHLNPTRVKLSVEVPFDELKPQFDKAYRALAGQVKIPGFPARQVAAPERGPPPGGRARHSPRSSTRRSR